MKLKKPTTKQNFCFGCGKDNPAGMHLKFVYDEKERCFRCRVKLTQRYQGPPGHAHGGIIATILDEAMSKVNKLRSVTALTREIKVEYLKPVPLSKPLIIEGKEELVRGRRHLNRAEIRDGEGRVLARGQGWFVAVDAAKMFAAETQNLKRRAKRNPPH